MKMDACITLLHHCCSRESLGEMQYVGMLEPGDLYSFRSTTVSQSSNNNYLYKFRVHHHLKCSQVRMLRPTVAAFNASSSAQHTTISCSASKSYSHRSKPPPQKSDQEVSPTKQWLAAHQDKCESIPRNIARTKTSASIGAG